MHPSIHTQMYTYLHMYTRYQGMGLVPAIHQTVIHQTVIHQTPAGGITQETEVRTTSQDIGLPHCAGAEGVRAARARIE